MSTVSSGRTLLLMIAGPAGSGKTTLCSRLLADFSNSDLQRVVTATSRAPRNGEVDGKDYYFIPSDQFRERINKGEFYEYAQVHGRFYGVFKSEIDRKLEAGNDLLLNIDVQGAATIRRAAREQPNLGERLVSVFVSVSPDTLRKRLETRGETSTEIKMRLESAEAERPEQSKFNYCFESGTRDADYERFRAIYLAEKVRVL